LCKARISSWFYEERIPNKAYSYLLKVKGQQEDLLVVGGPSYAQPVSFAEHTKKGPTIVILILVSLLRKTRDTRRDTGFEGKTEVCFLCPLKERDNKKI